MITKMQLEGMIILAVLTLLVCFGVSNYLSNQNGKYSIAYTQKSKRQLIAEVISINPKVNGIYFLPQRAKVIDALMASGIENIRGYENKILNRSLSGGECIEIKTEKQLKICDMNNTKKLILGIPLNINKVSSTDLVLIPGIGEKTAEEIIQFRSVSGPFKKLEDMMNIRGIKEKKYERLKNYFCIDCR